jgi:hypothetical protein
MNAMRTFITECSVYATVLIALLLLRTAAARPMQDPLPATFASRKGIVDQFTTRLDRIVPDQLTNAVQMRPGNSFSQAMQAPTNFLAPNAVGSYFSTAAQQLSRRVMLATTNSKAAGAASKMPTFEAQGMNAPIDDAE